MLEPAFSYTFSGQIWRVLADVSAPLLSIEIRQPDHRVSFAVLNVATRQLLWKDFVPPERWWSSSALLHHGVLLLQTFPDGQNPDPRGLWAIDAYTSRILWTNPEKQLLNLYTDTQILTRNVKENIDTYAVLELENGQVIEISPEMLYSGNRTETRNRLFFPVHYPADSPYVENIAGFLSEKLKVLPEKVFDYLEYNQYIVISYYIYSGKELENFLVVFDTHSHVLRLHSRLATQRTGIGKDTFFIFDQLLFFVHEQTTFLGYELY